MALTSDANACMPALKLQEILWEIVRCPVFFDSRVHSPLFGRFAVTLFVIEKTEF